MAEERTVLQESEQVALLNSILESSTEYSIVAKDLDGLILAWNEGARRIYGYAARDVVGRASAFILHDPEDVKSGLARTILDEARRTGKWEGELRRVRKDGTRFTAHVTFTLRHDATRGPIGFTMISRDLTHAQQIERELRESQEYNRGLIESNIDALMTTDPLGIITDVNRQMCEMTGYSREELIGTPFKNYFTDPRRAEDGIRKVLAEDRVTNYELTMRAKNGQETVVSYNATTFRGADGRLRGVFAAARDITDQKGLEEELRQTQNYTRGLIEASVDALVTVDPEFRVTDVNEQTVRTTGYSREELVGSPFPDYFTDPERATAGVQQTLGEGLVTNYVLVLRSKDGRETPVSFNASVFRDTEGSLRGIFAAARDITEQKRLEEELRQAQNYTRGLIESSVDPMITVDSDLTITDVNEQMVRLTEVPKAALIGSRFDRYFTEPSRATAGVRQTLREGFVTNYELTLHTPSGRQVLVSFNASIFRDPEGNIRGIFAVARDVTEQRRLEQELREQQNYSRGLIEASVDALMTVDPNGVITDVNEQTVQLTGYNRQQLIGSRFADYFTEPERATAGVRKTFDEGVVTDYQLVVRTKTGTEMVVSFNASVFKDTAGNVAGILAAARDVTQRIQIEGELREQQAYNRGLIESNIDALMTTDPIGIITDVNRQMCEVTGRTREELIGTPFKNCFTDPQLAEDGIRKVLAEGRVTNYELTLRAKDGKETVVSYNATTFRGQDGRLRGVFAAARDITDQKRLEEQLRQAQNYNRGLIESSVDAMLTVDPELVITDVNEQMVRLTGYSRDQLIGSSFQDYFTEPERAATGVRQTLREGYVTNYELTLRSRYRRDILVSFNASVFKDTDGNVRGIFAVARDVTEQRRLEEQLREQQNYNRGLIESSVDALVTVDPDLTITDVNEQMVRLTGYEREALIGSPFKDYFTEPVAKAAERCARIVKNFLAIARERPPERGVVSLNQVVREAVELLAYPLRVDNVQVSLQLAEDLPALWADPHSLHQVTVNLIANAHQALQNVAEPRRLSIAARYARERNLVVLEVADNGPGIPPEIAERIFEPFFTTKPAGQGTGLGLALCRGIVESHHGTIDVETAAGHGALFRIELPVETKPTASEGVTVVTKPRRGRTATILVVDDEADVGQMLADVLAEDGHRVEVVRDGGEALRKLDKRRFDLVITDMKMPGLDGRGLYEAAIGRDPRLAGRFVFLTGDTLGGDTSAFLDRTQAAMVVKPFALDEFLGVVRRLLAQ